MNKSTLKLSELKTIVDENLSERGDVDVKVKVWEDSLGATPSVGICDAFIGIDWDSGQFLLMPNVPICRKDNDREEYERLRRAVLEYLWDRKDKKWSFETKQFIKALSEKPKWFK